MIFHAAAAAAAAQLALDRGWITACVTSQTTWVGGAGRCTGAMHAELRRLHAAERSTRMWRHRPTGRGLNRISVARPVSPSITQLIGLLSKTESTP